MQGLTLSREFYQICKPILMREIPDIISQSAIGLVGEGSECFGFDDEISHDHDFGPAFCLWLPQEILSTALARINKAFDQLPNEFAGFPNRMRHDLNHGRAGAMSIEDFYNFYIGLNHAPRSFEEWLHIPEYQLAACTNGEVFEDNLGEFSIIRKNLLAYYPRDVWLKKLAGKCMIAAQAGQYNLPRCLERNDIIASLLSTARFAEAAISIIFILNQRYMPFYKWAGKTARSLPIAGNILGKTLDNLGKSPLRGKEDLHIVEFVEEFCETVTVCLNNMDLSNESDPWLWLHGPKIMSHVKDSRLRAMNILMDF